MEKDLEKYLKILNSDRCLKKPKEAAVVLEKIKKCFNEVQSQFTISLLIGLLLEETNAIFTFIWKTSSDFETVSSTTAAFKLLEYLVANFQSCTEPYFPILLEKCVYLLNREFAKVKEESLKLLKNLIVADSRQVLDLSKLIPELERHCRETTKMSGTVSEQIYGLLGYLFEKHPESMRNKEWVLENMCENLRFDCEVTKNPSLGRIKGAFEGINGYLTNYPLPNTETAKTIYDYVKKLCKFRQELHKKEVSRAGLKILQNHWVQFSSFMYDDREFWRINLEVWTMQRKEDHLATFQFLCAFYSVIALYAKQDPNNSQVSGYVQDFTARLQSDSSSYEKRSALVGIKLFVLTDSLNEVDFHRTHEVLMNFIRKYESYSNLAYYPLCLECVSAFVLKLSSAENVSMEQLAYLQKLSVKLMDAYPTLETELQPDALISLEKSFYILSLSNSQIIENHIGKVLYQGLIKTCSSVTLNEIEMMKETQGQPREVISYKSYLSLWKYLLTLASSPILPLNGSFSLKKGVASRVFDVFVESFLKIVSKLNFSLSANMEVENPSDLSIFINMIDLYQDLTPFTDPFLLQKWLAEIFRTTIHLSRKNPLVSGFYKITAVNLKLADSLEFFDDFSREKEKSLELVGTFLEETLPRIDQYKGELQMACLKMILSAPVRVIQGFAEKTLPALEVAIHLARSCFPLLKDLIETLERWDLDLPSETSNAVMEKVLPYFDVFLQSPYFSGNNLVDAVIEGKKLKKKVVFNDSELLAVQKKFLMFLGQMETGKAVNLIGLTDTEESSLGDRHLMYRLPFVGGGVEINLNDIMPRIMDLAVSCIDRKTRVTACELLYSGVMVLLGNTKQLSGGYSVLFRKTIRTCLVLGCDSDGVICQIFEPLMYQIVRYFSGKEALNFPESNDVIDTLMDYVTRPYNPTLRDFSAHLIKEFTVWSVRQLTPEELKVTPKSVSRILKNIYSLALHPSFNKRLGAAVVFNRIYSVLREEEFILNAYWFQLFYHFMESLRMCEGPEDVSEISEAIQHVKRPLVEKYAEFNVDSPGRKVPPEFEGGRLCHLVKWTLERTCDVKPATRRTAMALVQDLAPLVENCDSTVPFVSKQLRSFFQLEGNSFRSDLDEEDFVAWLNHEIAGFEYCTWLLEEKVMSTEEVFQPQLRAVLKSYIAAVLSLGESIPGSVEVPQQESVLAFLKLLYALRERAYLYLPEMWQLLKVATFTPTSLGFRVNQTSSMEHLSSLLTDLLKYFSTHLTAYDGNAFYSDVETTVNLPSFSQIITNQEVDVKNLEFLFMFRVMEASGFWLSFREKIFFSMGENLLVWPIFKSLFLKRGKTVYAATLEPTCRLYLEEILEIVLRVSEDSQGIFACLANEEEVREEETGKTVKKGEFFQFVFKNVIFSFLERRHTSLMERIQQLGTVRWLKLLVQIVENLSGESELPAAVLQRWQDFEALKMKDVSEKQKNRLLLQLAVSCAKAIGTPGVLKGSPVLEMIYHVLENEKFRETDAFEEAFTLLPFLSDFAEDTNDRLDAFLSKFDMDQINPKGSKTVQLVVNGVLRSLKITASLVLFRFAISRVAWFDSLCSEQDIESVLNVFAERAPPTHSVNALKLAFHFCFKDEEDTKASSAVYRLFLNPLMRLLPSAAVHQAVDENLEELCELLTTHWGNEENLKKIKADMIKKKCAAGIFQIFVKKLTEKELGEMPKERRQLIDTVVKKAFFLLKHPPPPKVLQERYRKLLCEFFNMICCIISARCKDEKFYKLFIFDERGSFLYVVVDKTSEYSFDMDFEEIPKRKKLLTNLRVSVAKESSHHLRLGQPSIKYIQTNTLFTSSLREDVTLFDLTHSAIRPMDSLPERTARNVEIDLEMDSLNSHECMPTLIATITNMVRDKIGPSGDDVTELPCWLKFFLGVLTNSDFCENLKFFILKAIYNVESFVAPYCKQVFPGMLDAMLELFKSRPVNYFLIDLVEIMIGWMYVPQEEKTRWQLTELVVLILNQGDSFRRDIVRNNMEVLKAMVEAWKSVLHLSELSSVAFKRLSKSIEKDLKSNANGDGLTYFMAHACGVLLSNGIPAWREGTEKKFFQLAVRNFREESRHNELFGEICGLALKYIEGREPETSEELEQLLRDRIVALPSCWLQILYGVHKHHPKMSSSFTYKIFSSAWDSSDSLLVRRLEMLLSHVSRGQGAEDPTFERHAHTFLADKLNSPDPAVQELSLRIADKLLDKFDGDKLTDVLKEVSRCQGSVHSDVRKWVYEIAMKLYGKSKELEKWCRIILLKGLADGVKELEDSCLEFWRRTLDLSSSGASLLLQVLKIMYTPETENIFLRNSVKVLLQFGTDSGQLEKHVFVHPITHQCRFQKRNLVITPRHSIGLRPTLSRTLTNESVEHIATLKHQNLPYVRPTASSLVFEPTVPERGEEVTFQSGKSGGVEVEIPSNPFKRRFYKDDTKTSYSFANWQKTKKKKEMEEEEETARKKERSLDIHGEYRDGDYPDIQIRHSQILKLFEALAEKDHHFARQFLVSLYSGSIKMVKSQEKAAFLSKTGKCFEEMLKSSSSFDPGVFGFVLQLSLKHARDLNLNCQLISNAAASSNWLSLGTLIIEETIANAEDSGEVRAKRSRGGETPEEVRWLELAKLYQSLEELDVLSGIFQDKLNVQSDAREAIHCETLMNWLGASKHYESALRTTESESESKQNEFYSESYFSCLAKLSNWSLLNKCIRSTVGNSLDEVWNNYNLLAWFIRSEMMISLGSDKKEFFETLEEFCKNAAKKSLLDTNFGEELAAFDLLSNRYLRACYRIDRLCLDFLAGWSHLDRWSYNLRAAKLASLQTLSELSFAASSLAEVSKQELERDMKVGTKRWEKCLPTASDDLTIWDVKLGYRRQFLKRLKGFDLTRAEVTSYLALAKAALNQANLNTAKEYLSRAKDRLPEGDVTLKAEHDNCFNLGKIVVARLKMRDESEGLEMYMNVYRDVFGQLTAAMETDSESYKSHLYSCNLMLGQLVSEMLPPLKKNSVAPPVLESIRLMLKAPENADVTSALQNKGLEHLEEAKAALEGMECPSVTKSNAYLELVKFLLKFRSSDASSDLEKLYVYTLRSMELGNPEARQLFGCLLNMSSHLEHETSSDVVCESERVPSWMFLTWTNQMLACLSSNSFVLLRSILLRITQDYPNAIRYALKLADERDTKHARTKLLFERLNGILSKDPLYDDFWNSMKFLAPPDLILSHHLEDILQEASQSDPDHSRLAKAISELKEMMFSAKFAKFRGPVFKVWEKFQEPLEDLPTGLDEKEVLVRKLRNLLSSVETSNVSSRKGLESYSPWLYNFHSLKVDAPLELPGQYDGDRRPIKQYLVTVTSFRNNVLVFSSKCRPMRITILGNDATEHKFLVKFGEDLRQDERIQQVFRHFSHRLTESKQTRSFSLDTYKVIPLTHSLGMIEWVENTVSLYEMLESSLENGKEALARAQNAHLTFLSQGSPGGSVAAHLTAYEEIKRESAISNFRLRVQEFPGNLLKRAFLSLSTSPEHFAHLRRNFATSHAVICVTHWLVGIGDRHLHNILVSTRTGRALGIDFGYSFGFATQYLTPPELVPFRLSPQILSLVHPLDESGWIKQTMIHCLRLFRKDQFKLVSVLEVFAQEPLMDWLKQARKSQLYKSGSLDTWYPREKLSLVERKLNGANPVSIFEADLRAGHSHSKYLAKYLEVLRGLQQENIRARCDGDGLTEVEQVECLIDLATDPHVLAKTYIGWNPWL